MNLENVTCIICNSKNYINFLDVQNRFELTESYKLVKCGCGLIFLNPRPPESEIYKFYKNNNYDPHIKKKKNYIFDTIYTLIKKRAFKRKFKIISKFLSIEDNQTHIDIGGGMGEFCDFIKNKGFLTKNYDSSQIALKISESNKIDTITSLNHIESNSIDCITAWHSIEHIHRIDSLFKNIQRVLKKEKYLFLCVPNYNSIDQQFFKKKWVAWDAPRHLYHFNPDVLKKLLENYKFKVVYNESLLQDTGYNILMSINKNSILSFMNSLLILIYAYIQIFIYGYKKSSSFIVVCQKQ